MLLLLGTITTTHASLAANTSQPLSTSASQNEQQSTPMTLAQVQAIVLKQNRDVLKARIEVTKNEAALRAVRATQYPGINVFGFEGIQATGTNRNNLAVLPGAFQPVTQLYRIRMQIDQANIALKIARQQLRLAKQVSIAEAKKDFLKMVALQSAVISRQENLEFLHALVGYVSAEVKRGAVLQVELLSAQAREAQGEYELERDADELITATQTLNRLLDRPLQTPTIALEETSFVANEQSAESVMTQATIRRPEVTNLKLNATKQHLESKITLSRYIPDLSFGTTAVISQGLDITLPRSFLSFGVLGVWEPWDWGRRREIAKVAARQSDELRVEASDFSDQVSVQADNARRALKVREKEIHAASLLESSSHEQLRIAHRRYKVGAAVLKDVIQAQADYSDAVAQSVKAKADYADALVEFDKAIGRDFD